VVALCTTKFNIEELYILPTKCILVFFHGQVAIISSYSSNWLVFITVMGCVYCTVRTESLCSVDAVQVIFHVWRVTQCEVDTKFFMNIFLNSVFYGRYSWSVDYIEGFCPMRSHCESNTLCTPLLQVWDWSKFNFVGCEDKNHCKFVRFGEDVIPEISVHNLDRRYEKNRANVSHWTNELHSTESFLRSQ
jgi:hypothetical protein